MRKTKKKTKTKTNKNCEIIVRGFVLASFPGPAQLPIAFNTASDEKLGGAWERG